MTSTTLNPTAHFVIGGALYNIMLDTQCTPFSCISKEIVHEYGLTITPKEGNITLGDGSIRSRIGTSSPLTFDIVFTGLKTPLPKRTFTHEFEILDNIGSVGKKVSFIMGRDLLKQYCESINRNDAPNFLSTLIGVELCFENEVPANLMEENYDHINGEELTLSSLQLGLQESDSLFPDDDLAPQRPHIISSSNDNEQYKDQRQKIINDADIMQEWNINEQITGGITHPEAIVKLIFKDGIDLQKLSRFQYPIPLKAVPFVDKVTEQWHQEGKDEPVSTNPGLVINVPLLAVPKVSGGQVIPDEARICCDPRIPNEALDYVDQFQLPLIRQQLELLSSKKFYGQLDLENCFFQCPIHPDTRYLAYTWKGIQYRFTHTPFGIKFITSHVQRFMSKLFADCSFVFIYVDNIFIASNSWEEHREHILFVIRRCNEHHIKLKKKAFRCGETLIYTLGHIVSHNGISIDPNKVKALMDWPEPMTGEGLQSFLGLAGFVRMFIRHYGELAGPLEAIKYHKKIEWDDILRHHFQTLKTAAATSPFLKNPDFNRPFYIQTDSSNSGCGAVLFQPEDGKDDIESHNIVALVSKHFNDTQRKYSPYKKELFGIVFALRQFHLYIAFRPDTHLYTDHKPLIHMFTSDILSPGLQMWLDVLLSYNFTIHHRPGFQNVLPDALSRMYTGKYEGQPWGIPKTITFVNDKGNELKLPELNNIMVCPILQQDDQIMVSEPPNSLPSHASSDLNRQLLFEMEHRGKVIPATEEERKQLILEEHAKGHFGREAIYHSLFHRNYWWPKMREQIQSVILRCNACMRHVVGKVGFKPAEYIISNGPWSHIQMDCCLSFPEAHDGSKVLLVIIDLFTSFVMVFPLKDKSAKSVAEKLWWVCSLFGLPSVLQSDNGKEFCNSVVKEMVKIMQIDLRFIAPYNPRCDGAVERAVGVVSTTIKKMLQGADIYWPLYCPIAQAYINNKIHSVKKSTPFSLMFGRSFNVPHVIASSDTSSISSSISDQQQWMDFQSRVNSVVYPEIAGTIQLNKEKMIRSVNRRNKLIKPDQFIEGTVVMLKDQRKQNKRDSNYVGPYIIKGKTDNGNYILVDNDGEEVRRQVPPDQLKYVHQDDATEDSTMHNMSTIKSILEHRGDPGITFEYLIQWNDGSTSWEPQSGLMDVDCIQKYWKKVQSKSKRESKLANKKKATRPSENKEAEYELFIMDDDSIPSDSLMGGGVDDVKDAITHQIQSHEEKYPIESSQKILDDFVNKFIEDEHLTTPQLNLKLRENKGLADRFQALLFTSGIRYSYPDALKRLRYILSQRFSDHV